MMLPSVEAARATMLAGLGPLGSETVPLAEGLGRVLAAEVRALRDQPPFAASAMDGWAVRAADGPGARQIVGESAAGGGFGGMLGPGEAVRIFTGAPLPEGADAVAIQEDARREGGAVNIAAVVTGRHVRPPGQDFRARQSLLAAGVCLDPWRLSLAAAAGAGRLEVTRRPRVAILSTGDELVAPGAAPGPHQIFDSGSTALAAVARTRGAEARALRAAGDDLDAIAAAVGEVEADLLVVVGGASVGDHDLVKPALARLGLRLVVDGVAVRPGKPVWFGRLADDRPVLGLPGNPASALVCAELFLAPILAAAQGADPRLALSAARAAEPLAGNGPREHWMRARLDRDAEAVLWARPFADQDSSLIAVFAASDALIRRPAGAAAAATGDIVEALVLPRG